MAVGIWGAAAATCCIQVVICMQVSQTSCGLSLVVFHVVWVVTLLCWVWWDLAERW